MIRVKRHRGLLGLARVGWSGATWASKAHTQQARDLNRSFVSLSRYLDHRFVFTVNYRKRLYQDLDGSPHLRPQ